jgi:branched-chain amino acid transport system permease protein
MSGLPQVILLGINIVPLIIDFMEFYAVYLAISLSLNLEFGFTGIPNFGKVLFVAGGAAFAGSITGRVAAFVYGIGNGVDFTSPYYNSVLVSQINTRLATDPFLSVELVILGLIIAAVIGAVLGFLASYPAIRLREDYLGLLLLGMAQFFQIILRTNNALDGGADGILVPDPYSYFSSFGPGVRDLVAAVVMSAFAVVVYIYIERTVRSPLGRTLRAVRDNEDASSALGKDTTKMKRNALMVASAIAAMAGALWAFYTASVDQSTWTRFLWTFFPFLIIIIGGAANNTGVVIGSFFFMLIWKGLQLEQNNLKPYIFFDPSYLQDLLFGALFLVILYIRPFGILREKPSFTLSKSALKSIVKEAGGKGEPGAPVEKTGRNLLGRLRRKSDGDENKT